MTPRRSPSKEDTDIVLEAIGTKLIIEQEEEAEKKSKEKKAK